jgi:hypothetical protein
MTGKFRNLELGWLYIAVLLTKRSYHGNFLYFVYFFFVFCILFMVFVFPFHPFISISPPVIAQISLWMYFLRVFLSIATDFTPLFFIPLCLVGSCSL